MLESIAIAALVVGGLSTAVVVTKDDAIAEQDKQPVVVEVQQEVHQDDTQMTGPAESPFLD